MTLLLRMVLQVLLNQEIIMRHLADEAAHRGDQTSSDLTRRYVSHTHSMKVTRWMAEIEKRRT